MLLSQGGCRVPAEPLTASRRVEVESLLISNFEYLLRLVEALNSCIGARKNLSV